MRDSWLPYTAARSCPRRDHRRSMFDALSKGFRAAKNRLAGVTELTDDNIDQALRDVRVSLLEADVELSVVKRFLANVKEKSVGVELLPVLPVEVVGPPSYADGQRFVGIADDGSEIVYEGDAALGKPAVVDPPARRAPPQRQNYDTPPAAERLEVTRRIPPVSARTTRAPVRSEPAPAAAGADYRAAVELVKSGPKDEAVTALRAFLKTYPRHEYADNAQYWLGEAFYAHKDYQHALVEFRATIETYPRGNKVPDALLKVGYCYQALGQIEKARAVLEQVVNLYPKTEPAALAAKRLESP